MARAIHWADSALDDLAESLEYLDNKDLPEVSSRLAQEAFAAAERLSLLSFRGTRVPGKDPLFADVRELLFFKRTYRLFYRIEDDVVHIECLMSVHQDRMRTWRARPRRKP